MHPTADPDDLTNQDRVFDSAATLFALLSTPLRLKIIAAVYEHEKCVRELQAIVGTTRITLSRHLAALCRSAVLARRRDGTEIYYRLQSQAAATLYRTMGTQLITMPVMGRHTSHS
jgi:ArsR family transcriptional regulator